MVPIRPAIEPKGKPPLRPCPDDFDVIFVEQGRLACEAWYRARRDTVNRWLHERGKKRLIALRAAYVASQRKAGRWMTRQTPLVEKRTVRIVTAASVKPVADRRRVPMSVAIAAARFLQVVRNGGYVVTRGPRETWLVGRKCLSAAQMVDLAKSRGFDPREVRE